MGRMMNQPPIEYIWSRLTRIQIGPVMRLIAEEKYQKLKIYRKYLIFTDETSPENRASFIFIQCGMGLISDNSKFNAMLAILSNARNTDIIALYKKLVKYDGQICRITGETLHDSFVVYMYRYKDKHDKTLYNMMLRFNGFIYGPILHN